MSIDEFYRLVDAFSDEAGGPHVGLRIGQTLTLDAFDPSLFAASCSPNMEVASARVAAYKRLMGPFRLDVTRSSDGLRLAYRCLDRPDMPALLGLTDLAFTVQWIRHATRAAVVPARVGLPELPEDTRPLEQAFGVRPQLDDGYALVFSPEDATRPFLTANPGLWASFEPELRRRLSEIATSEPVVERARAALLELLPSGRAQKNEVAKALGVSPRTLQRRLHEEDTTFQRVLAKTRESLARHYLARTELTPSEIAYLLGFDDPNSLYRAFQAWTGTTPEAVRRAARGESD